jgi:hypothetical protein
MSPARLHPLRAILAAAALSCLPAHATVDDAHSAALEAAQSAVEDGFKIRQEYWKGKVTSGQQKMVKHQLFKDSAVWFWLGSADEGHKLEIEIYDAKGVKVASEKKSGKDFAALKLTPPKTGTYLIVFKITGRPDEQLDWALVYGWK